MKNLKFSIFSAIVVMMAMLSSCTKDVSGPQGPAGPQGNPGQNGANGNSGAPGQNGTNGTNGTNGNANVTDFLFTVPGSGWSTTGTGNTITGNQIFYYTYPMSINNQGAVMVYIYDPSNSQYSAIPWTDNGFEYAFSYDSYGVTVVIQPAMGTGTYSMPTTSAVFKVVLIPPAMKAIHPEVDYKSYEQVKRVFNIN